jgi:HSP20 family protein
MGVLTHREGRRAPDLFERLDVLPELFSWVPGMTAPQIKVEEFTEDGRYVVRAELPGVDPDKDVTVEVVEGLLTIRAERHEEVHEAGRTEFRYGTLVRRVGLPTGVTEAEVTATYTDGILEVTFPIAAKTAEARKVTVRR